jgi:hypothetical protein
VYNVLSFSLASMMATTIFLWMRMPGVKDCYQSALIISGLVAFIAAYHYIRIFNSWVEAYEYKPNSSGQVENPTLTGVPFNDNAQGTSQRRVVERQDVKRYNNELKACQRRPTRITSLAAKALYRDGSELPDWRTRRDLHSGWALSPGAMPLLLAWDPE